MQKFFLSILLIGIYFASAQTPGSIDSTFGVNGVFTKSIYPQSAEIKSLAVQQDGRIIVGANMTGEVFSNNSALIMRYKKNGGMDASFGDNGKVIFDDPDAEIIVTDVAIQEDGKILIAATKTIFSILTKEFLVYRILSNGSMDDSFGADGIVSVTAPPGSYSNTSSLEIQPDEKIILLTTLSNNNVTGTAIYRFLPDGQPDYTFGKNGVSISSPGKPGFQTGNVMKLQSDGKILVGGDYYELIPTYYYVARYTTEGKPDHSFADDGFFKITLGGYNGAGVTAMGLQPDGGIVCAGFSSDDPTFDLYLFRLTENGDLDLTFGNDGISNPFITDQGIQSVGPMVIQPDGKIILPLVYYELDSPSFKFHIARFNEDGTTDSEWENNGVVTTAINRQATAYACALQDDGKLLVGGSTAKKMGFTLEPVMVRYNTDQDLRTNDLTIVSTSAMIYPTPVNRSVTFEYTLDQKSDISIQLLDINGRVLKTFLKNEQQDEGKYHVQLDLPELSSGIFILHYVNSRRQTDFKVIKQSE